MGRWSSGKRIRKNRRDVSQKTIKERKAKWLESADCYDLILIEGKTVQIETNTQKDARGKWRGKHEILTEC